MVCQLRKAWNACQADVEACMKCEIWLETSPYKHQPKQMTKYEVEVPKRATEANDLWLKLRGRQTNPQNKAWRPIRFHRGDPSDPRSQTVYCTCVAVWVPGAHVQRELCPHGAVNFECSSRALCAFKSSRALEASVLSLI